jgi:FMN-dependent oxidoreductase (nitrilotriacetate monooxygenase family)
MTLEPRRMHLNVNLAGAGAHPGAWRLDDKSPTAVYDAAHYEHLARVAERGLFDAVFLADNSYLHPGTYMPFVLDPFVLATAMSRATERVGIIATVSTTFHEPYTIARAFASLDQVSAGRAGWNVVTTRNRPAGHNYGFEELPTREARYARAAEALDVALALWDSWEPGALVADPVAGVLADQSLIHPIDHVGEHFRVAGPMQVPPSPQRRPLIVQAGGSVSGVALAARHAEAVFTSQLIVESAREFYRDLKAAVVAQGRPAASLAVLPGVFTCIGSTEAEAWARLERLNELAPPTNRLVQFASWIGVDPEILDLDKPFPLDVLPQTDATYGSVGFDDSARAMLLQRKDRTVGEILDEGPIGHWKLIGTPEQVADGLEHWLRTEAADGFNLLCDSYPSGLETFVDEVVPLLRKRGLFREDYDSTTLRGHYGVEL